jgi:hypothetical protein
MLIWFCGAVLFFSSAFGGGTHAGYLGDVAAQFLSIPLLIAGLWPAFSTHDPLRHKAQLALAICAAAAFVVFIQLLPLPFNAPGASLFPAPAKDSGLLAPSWMPLSRTPEATWAAAVSLIVPLAVFAAAMRLGHRQRLIVCWMFLGFGALSLLLGFMQVAQGPQSALRFYSVTNAEDAVGLFANRNHFAAHLYVTLILAAMWVQMVASKGLHSSNMEAGATLTFAAAAAFFVAVVGGLAFSRSRGGMILAITALAGIAAIVITQAPAHRNEAQRGARRATIAVLAFATLFTVTFGLGRLLTRFEPGQASEARGALAQATFEMAFKSLPFGTGLGSFVPVYATIENAADLGATYANRAHNDLAELLLETGALGGVALLAFLFWFARRAWAIWFDRENRPPADQVMLEKSATLIVALLLAHSLVDYPLRTGALSAMFAFFCAILAAPAAAPRASDHSRKRHVPPPLDLKFADIAAPAEKWGNQVQWPDSWKR